MQEVSEQKVDYTTPVIQCIIFIASVYLQKFVRKNVMHWPKSYKQISRISFVTILTLFLVLYNYSTKCQPQQISLKTCFYFHFDFMQCLHAIIANSLLFGYQIYVLTVKRKDHKFFSQNSVRKLVFASLLEEILFRSVFYRSAGGNISIVFLSALFSIAHLHRYIRKAISGKQKRIGAAMFQLLFTFIFSMYTYYFLSHYRSVIPCILLHSYCNLLGPPLFVQKKSVIYHFICLVAFIAYMVYFV